MLVSNFKAGVWCNPSKCRGVPLVVMFKVDIGFV